MCPNGGRSVYPIAHFLPLSHPFIAQEVARTFLDNVVKLYGVPQAIISDKDKSFSSLLWQ